MLSGISNEWLLIDEFTQQNQPDCDDLCGGTKNKATVMFIIAAFLIGDEINKETQ